MGAGDPHGRPRGDASAADLPGSRIPGLRRGPLYGRPGFSRRGLLAALLAFILIQLHHSHVWIAFQGWLGRLFISPAAHQIHHSADPIHFDKNFGSCLAIFDWLFGTLHMPAKHREHLTFGVPDGSKDPHSLTQSFFTPFIKSAEHIYAGASTVAAKLTRRRQGKQEAGA